MVNKVCVKASLDIAVLSLVCYIHEAFLQVWVLWLNAERILTACGYWWVNAHPRWRSILPADGSSIVTNNHWNVTFMFYLSDQAAARTWSVTIPWQGGRRVGSSEAPRGRSGRLIDHHTFSVKTDFVPSKQIPYLVTNWLLLFKTQIQKASQPLLIPAVTQSTWGHGLAHDWMRPASYRYTCAYVYYIPATWQRHERVIYTKPPVG